MTTRTDYIENDDGTITVTRTAGSLTGRILRRIQRPGEHPYSALYIDIEGNLVARDKYGHYIEIDPVRAPSTYFELCLAAARAKNGPSPALPALLSRLSEDQWLRFYDRLETKVRLAVIQLIAPPTEVPVGFTPAAPE